MEFERGNHGVHRQFKLTWKKGEKERERRGIFLKLGRGGETRGINIDFMDNIWKKIYEKKSLSLSLRNKIFIDILVSF